MPRLAAPHPDQCRDGGPHRALVPRPQVVRPSYQPRARRAWDSGVGTYRDPLAGQSRPKLARRHPGRPTGRQTHPGPLPGPHDPPGRQEGRTHPTRGRLAGPRARYSRGEGLHHDRLLLLRPGLPGRPRCHQARAGRHRQRGQSTAPRPSPRQSPPWPHATRGSVPTPHVITARSSATTASWPRSASTRVPTPQSSSAVTPSRCGTTTTTTIDPTPPATTSHPPPASQHTSPTS